LPSYGMPIGPYGRPRAAGAAEVAAGALSGTCSTGSVVASSASPPVVQEGGWGVLDGVRMLQLDSKGTQSWNQLLCADLLKTNTKAQRPKVFGACKSMITTCRLSTPAEGWRGGRPPPAGIARTPDTELGVGVRVLVLVGNWVDPDNPPALKHQRARLSMQHLESNTIQCPAVAAPAPPPPAFQVVRTKRSLSRSSVSPRLTLRKISTIPLQRYHHQQQHGPRMKGGPVRVLGGGIRRGGMAATRTD
jgi:hypothetical protein